MAVPTDLSVITDIETLKALHRAPMSRASDKVLDHLDQHCQAILALSPFCVLSSQGPTGADVSPRGDPPGFLRVLNDRQLLLPDRVGNNRLDNFANLLSNPMIGLLVLVPGMDETLRINGTAQITDDRNIWGDGAKIRCCFAKFKRGALRANGKGNFMVLRHCGKGAINLFGTHCASGHCANHHWRCKLLAQKFN